MLQLSAEILIFIFGFFPLGLILIDHGHFQYNGISLGLMVFAVTSIMRDKVIKLVQKKPQKMF